MISVLILAAGLARRMKGGDKLQEDVQGTPCLTVLVTRARTAGFDAWVVVPALDHPRAALAAGATLVPAPEAHRGMAHSLRAGLAALPDEAHAVIVLPGDMPEIKAHDFETLARHHELTGKGIVQAATPASEPGHPVLFARKYFDEMARLTGDRGAAKVIETHRDDWLLVPLEDDRARLDLDTPEDWAAWRRKSE